MGVLHSLVVLGTILQYLSDKTLQITKLCAFSSDGASVMTGRLTGVAVRLLGHSPNMIAVHCVNHRLALAAAQASDSVVYLKQLSTSFKPFFTFIKIVLCV